ncbi:DUF1016 N-terminal domain-containing protein [Legionella sp. WA2024007413]
MQNLVFRQKLRDMRRFYLEYEDHSNLRQLVAEIPWGQNLLIMNKVKDNDERHKISLPGLKNKHGRVIH